MIPWTVAHEASLSVGFSRQGHWSGYSHSLLQGIFPAEELNPHLLHCRQILYCLSQGSPHRAVVFSLPDMTCSVSVRPLSRVRLFATPWTAACQAPVHHQLPEPAQTDVHRVSDAIQPSHPLSYPSAAFNLLQHQALFQ